MVAFVDNNIALGNSVNDVITAGTGPTPNQLKSAFSNAVTRNVGLNDIGAAGSGSNTIVGGSGNDVISFAGTKDLVRLGSGHNTVNGGSGLDTITSGMGDAIVNADNGTDVILLGSGDNEIYADSQASLGDAIAQAATATASHKKGDLISVLDGNDTVVGGNGDDLINAGNGQAVVVMGPGEDTFLGGWELTNGTGDWSTQIANNVVTVSNVTASVTPYLDSYPQPYNGNFVIEGQSTLNAGVSNETVFGGSGNDLIEVGNGNNYVEAGSGNTEVSGGMGNDTIIGGSGFDTLRGGGGNTYIEGGSGTARIWGGDGNNTIIGGSGVATITSAAADSTVSVNGRWQNDTLSQNYVFTGDGTALVFGSAGYDTLIAGSGTATIIGGLGTEYIVGGSGKDLLVGGQGNDTLIAGSGDATLQAGGASTTASWLYGGDGTDIIVGGLGQNYLFAGDGGTAGNATTVMGGTDASSTTTISGGIGVDYLQGGAGTTVINVGDGGTMGAFTTVIAGSGATTVFGGAGIDFIQGGSGVDVLNSGDGGTSDAATTVVGMSASSTLIGGAGAAMLYDNTAGSEVLIAGSGSDTLVGGGQDTFVAGTGEDTIQNNGGHVTVNLGSEFGDVAAYNSGSGTVTLGIGGGLGTADLAASVTFDGFGHTFLALATPDGSVSIDGALTGRLSGTQFDSGGVSTAALMTSVFHGDQAFQNGGSAVHVDVTAGESISRSNWGDIVSAWGADETIQGGSSELIYSDGARALIQGGYANDSIMAAGDHDTVVADQYQSWVTVSGANSVAVNQTGNDWLTASGAGDTLIGGLGTTQFVVNDSTATVVSNNVSGQDAITSTVNFTLPTNVQMTTLTLAGTANIVGTGNAGLDILTGGAGHDTLVSGSGVDTLIGGTTATTFVVNNSNDTVVENNAANVDTVVSSVNYVLPASVNILALNGSAALTATANSGADTLISNTGIDTLYGGGGGDLFIINNAADKIVEAAGAANDTLEAAFSMTLPTNVNSVVLMGSAALSAQANNGNDTLVSNTGVDTLIGGAGNDTFVVNNALDTVQGASATSSNTIIASVSFTLPVNVNTLTLTGTAALQATGNAAADIITANAGNDTLTAVSTAAATTLVGGAGNDVFVVNNTADVVRSASTTANDTIQSTANFTAVANVNTLVLAGTVGLKATANDAGDTLVSNTGVDTLVGGAGNDVFIVNNSADVLQNVSIADTVESSIGLTVPLSVDNLVLIGSGSVKATTNDNANEIVGNAGNDTIVATVGQDTLVAGTGVDTLVAGTGNDLFVVDNTSDVVSLSGAHGVDTIQSSINWTLQAGINMLVLTGTGNLTGRAVSGNNRINANAGSDTLYAGSGMDTLSAQAGPATLVGGAGTDTFIIGNAADVIQNISASGNTVYSSVSYTMQAGVSVVDLFGITNISVTGNGVANSMSANAGNDTLTAGTGVAQMQGGMGADLFIIDNISDVVSDAYYAQKGVADTIQSSVSYTLPGTVDNLVLTSTADLKAVGNQNADVLVGNSGKDTLVAGSGDDTLVSGSGVTLLQGGPGNDTYVVNNALDTVITNAADSYNVLQSSVTYTMPANISELLLIGSASIKGTSNGLDVLMTAGDGADTLVATTGQDTLAAGNGLATLVGGTGNDTFVVNNSNDVVTDATTNKSNVILASASFVLPANIETLTLTGSGDLSATGNADGRIDTLNAGYGNDTLFAGADVAVMNGGSGPTTFVVNNTSDVVQNAGAAQANSLQSSVSYMLPTNVNLLTLTGSNAITGRGNTGADTLVGNTNADTLVSGSGNDLFVLGSATTKVTNAFTTNSDTLQSAFNAALSTNVNTLVLTGTAALTGQANGGNDTLISNTGVDLLTGGAGNDVFVINNSADTVTGASATSSNTIVASVSFTLPANVKTLTLTGTSALQGTGNAAADLITANAGNDTLTAVSTTAATTLVGGVGNDLFVVNNTADVVLSASATANDTIQSSANFTAVSNVNTLVLTGAANLQATANDAGDTLVSNTGVDTLVGGAGNDVFMVNNAADVLVNLGAGDTVESSVAYSMATPGITLVLTGAANRAVTVSGNSDVLVAGDGNDTLTAAGTNDTLFSGAGSDLFIVNDASNVVAETVAGGAHSIQSSVSYTLPDHIDTLTLAGSGNLAGTGNSDYDNVLIANSGNNVLNGTALNNTLLGGSGSDTIYAGTGANLIHAGSGGTTSAPTYVYGANGGGGNSVDDIIYGDTGVNVLAGGAGYNTIVGGSGTTKITAAGLSNLVSLGLSGTTNSPAVADVRGESTTSQTTVNGGAGVDLIYGGSGADLINAGTGAATIYAGSGYDSIYGNAGSVVLDARSGNALLVAGSGSESMAGWGHDTMVAGSGVDKFTSVANSQITYEIPLTIGTVTIGNVDTNGTYVPTSESLLFGSGVTNTTLSYGVSSFGYGSNGPEVSLVISEGTGSVAIGGGVDPGTITGVKFADSGATESLTQFMNSFGVTTKAISFGSGYNEISTGDGQSITATNVFQLWAFGNNDVVVDPFLTAAVTYGDQDTLAASKIGAYGNGDVLTVTGATGHATLGGANDTVSIGVATTAFITIHDASDVIEAAGPTSLITTVNYTLPTNVNSMVMDSSVGGLTGISNAIGGRLVATGNGDTLRGGAGADTLSAQGLNDVLVGGSGAETYIINDGSDSIAFGSGAASLNIVQAASSFALPSGANTLIETGAADVGTGNGGNDTLSAQGYGDTLIAGSGNSTLIQSGVGPIVFVGGAGNDLFVIKNVADTVQDASSATNSTIQSAVSFTLPANVNTLILTGPGGSVGQANSGSDRLSSTNSNDTLVAGTGADTLVGGVGVTTFVFNSGFAQDQVVNVQNGDVLEFGLGINKSNLTFSALQGATGMAPSLVVTGTGGGAVTLQGGLVPGAISSVVFGDGTTSTIPALIAPTGHSTVVGPHGNIIFSTVNNDSIVGGSGQDTIVAWGSNDTLSAGSGGALIYAAGSNSRLTGSAGADTLTAVGASSTLVGGAGSEVFSISDSTEVIQVITTTGQDTVLSSVSYTLPANMALLQLTGSANLVGTGNASAGTIEGNSGSDTLTAGSAATTLIGGSGADLFVVNSAADTIQLPFGGESDTVASSAATYTLPSGIGALQLTGVNTTGTGNGQNDLVVTSNEDNDLHGGAGSDILISYAPYDDLYGGTGSDLLVSAYGYGQLITSATGIDTVQSRGAGDDIYINNSSDVIATMGQNDNIFTSVNFTLNAPPPFNSPIYWTATGTANVQEVSEQVASSVRMTGNTGRDTLVSYSGGSTFADGHGSGSTAPDVFIGYAGGDNYSVQISSDVVEASGVNNEIDATVSYALPNNVDKLVLYYSGIQGVANSDNDTISTIGGTNDTLIAGSGNDSLNSTFGNSFLVAGSGSDTLVSSSSGGDVFVLNSGFGSVEAKTTDASDPTVRFGSVSAPSGVAVSAVFDSTGNAALKLTVGAGTVTLDGALSGTSYQFQFGSGAVMNMAQFMSQASITATTVNGGAGNLMLSSAASQALTTGTGSDSLFAAGANDTLTAGAGTQLIGGFGVADSLIGGNGLDTLQAFGLGDTLVGGSGSNLLQAYGNNEVVKDGVAADTMVGGDGVNVLFLVNNTADTVQTTANEGIDTISSSVNYQLPTFVPVLVLSGSSPLQGTGNSGTDTLISNSGQDTLFGGLGSDLFVLNNALDVVSVGSSHGADTIQTAFNDTLAANVSALVLTGSTALMGTGNMIANILQANDAGDTLVAGIGAATMIGGAGNDLFMVNSTADSIQSVPGAGVDTISSSVSYALPTYANTLVLTGAGNIKGTGNAVNDLLTASTSTGKVTLVAGGGADTLVSGTGVDSLVGGTGNDLFVINNASDVVSVASALGSDTIQSSFTRALATNVNTLVLTGSGAIAGTANSGNDLITAGGTTGAVTLNGGTGVDTLAAGSGADVLVAGAGIDSMLSGSGNDKFVVNNTGDIVVNSYTTNVDTISSSATYTLPANVNTLVLTGTGIVGTGNAGKDLITASTTTGAVTLTAGAGTVASTLVSGSGADVLTSNSGIDSLVGGTGADLFILANAADIVTVGTTHGVDTIKASFNDTLAANVGVLVLTGTAALMGTGNSLADTLTANTGNDTLVAGTGLATMIGGTGNDLFVINATGDAVTVATAGVSDTIQSAVSYTLPTNVQYLKLTGTASLVGGGNGATSLVVGNTGNDTLNGGTGVAVLEAGTAGAQVLKATGNQAALIGGGAANTLTGGAFKDFFAAGKVGDVITTGATANVIAFNKGDGATAIAVTVGASDVLSLGAGIDTEALTLTKSGNNLVLNDGVAGDSVTFTNWFAATANQTTKTLQVIEAASASYNSTGTDALRNKPIEEFNFTTLVSQFTTAGSPAAWALSQKEAADTIASSATSAYGGDLAYYEGKNGNLTGMNLSASQSTLTNASYATGLQTIDAWAGISGGTVTLNAIGGTANATPQGASTPTTRPTVDDGRVTVQPVGAGTLKQATYVSATQLAAALQTEPVPTHANWAHQRETFSTLWSSMHRQIDMERTAPVMGPGAEAQVFDLVPDAVAMLSGGAATSERRIVSPSPNRLQA